MSMDPEEAFVASVSSCHMLWFLSLAQQQGLVVDSYVDPAQGKLGAFDDGREGTTEVVLRPRVVFGGSALPDAAHVDRLHHDAHERCYIANSVRSEIRIEGSFTAGAP